MTKQSKDKKGNTFEKADDLYEGRVECLKNWDISRNGEGIKI